MHLECWSAIRKPSHLGGAGVDVFTVSEDNMMRLARHVSTQGKRQEGIVMQDLVKSDL